MRMHTPRLSLRTWHKIVSDYEAKLQDLQDQYLLYVNDEDDYGKAKREKLKDQIREAEMLIDNLFDDGGEDE